MIDNVFGGNAGMRSGWPFGMSPAAPRPSAPHAAWAVAAFAPQRKRAAAATATLAFVNRGFR